MSLAAARRRGAASQELADRQCAARAHLSSCHSLQDEEKKKRFDREGRTGCSRKGPRTHALYPLLALCVLAAVCWVWRESNLSVYFSAPPGVFVFLSTASNLQASATTLQKGAEVHPDAAADATKAPLRVLSAAAEEASSTSSSGSIPIAPSLAFFSFLFFFAILLQWLVSKIPVYPPPVSIIWFVFGMAAYGVASIPSLLPAQPWEKPGGGGGAHSGYQAPLLGHNILQTAILEMRFVDSSVVYYVMMPILLYEATQNINWHKFKKFLAGGLTLAVLGVALQVGILGVLFYYTCIGTFTQWADHAWTAAFLLAATLSSTDPVAVLSVLNAVNASDKLCTMFDGESLINDGSAVLLFQFFFFLLQGVAETPLSIFIMFVKLLFLGPAFGVAVGFLAYAWLLFFRKHPLMQCLAYITFCYVSYFLAEAVFSLSGPLTAVCYGLFIKAYGHIALDRDAQSKHYTFVAGKQLTKHQATLPMALMANCTIFIVSGIVTYGMMSSVFTRKDGVIYWLHLLLTYLYLNGARIIMIVLFLPILRRTGYGLTWKEAILLVWGGLRGGIVLALGLRIERDGDLDADLTNTLSFFISGSVFLILLINGMTFELLYRLLNPYPPKPFRRVYLEAVMRMIDHQYLEDRKALENHWLFKGTDVLAHADRVVPKLGWRRVDRLGNLDIKCPDITQAFMSLHEAAIYSWVVPSEQFQDEGRDHDMDTSKDSGKAEGDRQHKESSSNSSPPAALAQSASHGGAAAAAAAAAGVPANATAAAPADAAAGGPSGASEGPPSSSAGPAAASASGVAFRSHLMPPAQPGGASSALGGGGTGLKRCASEGRERDTSYAEPDASPSGLSSIEESPCGSPDAPLSREREGSSRRRAAAAEQERQAHSLAARGQGLKQSGARGFDPKFNLRLIEHATTEAADREVYVRQADGSDVESRSGSDRGDSMDVLEVTLQGEDPTTHVPLYRLTCRGGGVGGPGEVSLEKKKDRSRMERALSTLRKVVLPRYLEHTPVLKHWNQVDLRRSCTVGSGTSRADDASKRMTNSSPVSKTRTGIGLYRPCRAETMQETSEARERPSPTLEDSLVNGDLAVCAAAAARAAALRDTRARRFDTDATIVFDVCAGAWDEPKKQKRGLFRLLSGKQVTGKRRSVAGTIETSNAAAACASSRRSSAFTQEGFLTGSPMQGALPLRVPLAEGEPVGPVHSAESPRDERAGAGEQRRVSLAPLPSIGKGVSSLGAAVKLRKLQGKSVAAAADQLEAGSPEAPGEPLPEDNIQKGRTSFSLASSESYFELPMSPRAHGGGDASYGRRKVLRKEREGELYLMIFNACREMYHRLYHKQCIGGSALLSLNTSLDLSNDFAVGKNLTGFEYEWSVLQSRLHCLQYQRNVYCCFWRNLPSAFLRSLLNSGACQSDLEQLLAFVDVHEELLDKGGRNMELLMGKGLLTNYKQQILSAKRFVLYIRDCYPDSFRFAVCKVAATLLLNLKMKLVKDTASKGLVLEEDKEKLMQILDEQQFRLSRFRPCLILIRPQACLPIAGNMAGFGSSTPRSNSRGPSPMAFSGDQEA
ncbi:hypothetical protein Esti_004280 [Eimeria stiedai]